jgi:hypothetical protein
MSIEDELRHHLRREADAVVLPERDPGRAVARARTRRRRRQAGLGAAAVVALVAVVAGVAPALQDGDGNAGDEGVDVATGPEGALPPTGPLSFDWQTTDDGLSGVPSSFQTDDGTVYALSTAPGFRSGAAQLWPRALYRLGDDGTWRPIDLESGDRPNAIDMEANGDVLYAVGTGPGDDDESAAQVSASTDGGHTWAIEDLPPVAPPDDDLTWLQDRYLTVETAGDTTIALVTTSFRVDVPASFPDLAGYHELEWNEQGVVLVPAGTPDVLREDVEAVADPQVSWDEAVDDPEVTVPPDTTPPTTVPADRSTAPAPPLTEEDVAVQGSQCRSGGRCPSAAPSTTVPADGDAEDGRTTGTTIPEDSRTLTWAELGLTGPDDLDPTYQVLRATDEGWETVDATGLSGRALMLGESGGMFVAEASIPEGPSTLISTDGAVWTPVSPPEGEPALATRIVSVGSALVAIGEGSGNVHVSTDAGGTWAAVDLAAAGVPEGSYVMSADSGPLGLALVVNGPDDTDPQLVVSGDLVDWTVTPVADMVGGEPNTSIEVTVGADRLVVTSTLRTPDDQVPSPSRTAVGTLTRN